MKVTRFKPVYIGNKVNPALNIKRSRKEPGVYLIKQGLFIVYVGYSATDIYRTALRHFQSWNDKTQFRATFKADDNTLIRIILCNAKKAKQLENAFLKWYEPKFNQDKLKGFFTDEESKVFEQYENTLWESAPF